MKLSSIKNAIENDLVFLNELQSWLEDKDADFSEKLEKVCIRYEIVSGAYFTKTKRENKTSNKDVEKWKKENL